MNHDTKPLFEVLLKLCCGIAKYKDQVRIKEVHTLNCTNFEISVHPADCRKIIGTQGAIIKSIQLIFSKAGDKIHRRIRVALADNDERSHEPEDKFTDPTYNHEPLFGLLDNVLAIAVDGECRCNPVFLSQKTIIEVFPPAISQALAFAINKVFYAYGRANGRVVEVEFANVKNT